MRHTTASLLICVLLLTGCATTTPGAAPATKPGNIKEWMAHQSRAKKKAFLGALAGAAPP